MRTIRAQQLKEMMSGDERVTVIDVLSPEQFQRRHIPGSHNIPVADPNFVKEVEDVVDDKSQRVVVYCASHDCDASPKAAEKLENAGFTEVLDFAGGMKEWDEAGLEVEAAT